MTLDAAGTRWLALIHSVPPKPDYLRVKFRRRLERIGARPLKSSVYVLPNSDEAQEDFEWLSREIRSEGGAAVVCTIEFLAGMTDEEMSAAFDTPEAPAAAVRQSTPPDEAAGGTTWVTREGVKIDRVASAWLIKRHIDARARFKFVAARGYKPQRGELRFDMYEAEYSHVGADCTFETLVKRFGLHRDAALRAIGEIVHDIDCKDEAFARRETPGVDEIIRGIVAVNAADEDRIARAANVFDDLYASLSKQRR